jgi:pimeloyl-ACP methyl ester carboxylesterase
MEEAPADLRVVRRGRGPAVLLVHGSAADRTTWMAQLAAPPSGLSLVAYDRRGSASAPLPPGLVPTTRLHADDAAALIRREPGGKALVCGSSYGAVIALELARSAPELVAGLVLCEPPLPASDLAPGAPAGFGCAFDRLVATAGGEAAGEMFLRAVLGDAAFDAVHPRLRSRLCAMWRQIRADMIALARTRVSYDELRAGVRQPCLLLCGERSPPHYAAAQDALERALSSARRALIPAAGHAMQLDNHRAFNRALADFAVDIGHLVPASTGGQGR